MNMKKAKKPPAVERARSPIARKGSVHEAKEIPIKGTLFADIPVKLPEEILETICVSDTVKIERIVSRGQASPTGFWYDQERSEFILIVQGSAGLKFENARDIVVLKTGDYLIIGAHVKHRLEWTDPTGATIWLAVHY
jgi:cupin 2 domain-containing protein